MPKSLFLLLAAFILISCKGKPDEETPASTQAQLGTEVIIETNKGEIRVHLHDDIAPITVKNFLSYVDDSFYDDTIFHRVISNFMIQGGGFALQNRIPKEKVTDRPIKNESPKTKSNTRGTLAMARTPEPDSASAQFFINVSNNDGTGPVTNLNYPESNGHGYAVFGEVLEGMEIVDQIKEVETHTTSVLIREPNKRVIVKEFPNVPVEPVIIKSIRRATKTP